MTAKTCPRGTKKFGNICVPKDSRGYSDSGMRLKFRPKDIKDGIEISVAGYKANPTDLHPIQMYVEIYGGKLRVHVWNGEEDPETIDVSAVNPNGPKIS
ncbi:unnamed protein product [marine sediment metagenome]|uniref:Uncharacterized protein n=1 Tax=marine sediment metagenome TaxID=412755 RepID=X1ALK1_9ZZZZ